MYLAVTGRYSIALACLIFLPLGLWLSIRVFPVISKSIRPESTSPNWPTARSKRQRRRLTNPSR